MTITKTINYETSDGEAFTDRHAAAAHQAQVDIDNILGEGKVAQLLVAGYEVRKIPVPRAKKADK